MHSRWSGDSAYTSAARPAWAKRSLASSSNASSPGIRCWNSARMGTLEVEFMVASGTGSRRCESICLVSAPLILCHLGLVGTHYDPVGCDPRNALNGAVHHLVFGVVGKAAAGYRGSSLHGAEQTAPCSEPSG